MGFIFSEQMINDVYGISSNEFNLSIYKDIFVGEECIGQVFYDFGAIVNFHYDYDPGYWGPTMGDSTPESLDFDYWFKYCDVDNIEFVFESEEFEAKYSKELSEMIPKLEETFLKEELTGQASDDFYDMYLECVENYIKRYD